MNEQETIEAVVKLTKIIDGLVDRINRLEFRVADLQEDMANLREQTLPKLT